MRRFAALLDALSFQAARNEKLRLMEDYFARAPDPDRGFALAALTGDLSLRTAKPKLIRELAAERVDPTLFALSYDYVGDLAETAALIWPVPEEEAARHPPPALHEVVGRMNAAGRSELPALVAGLLDAMNATERWAFLKLITGGLRVGVSARLAKTALAGFAGVALSEIEEVWHAAEPPYAAMFAWLAGAGPRPETSGIPTFRPMMLANPVEERDFAKLDPASYLAEWKWDGIRVQIVALRDRQGALHRRIYSRTGDEIGNAFPDVVEAIPAPAVLDGELLVVREGEVAPFADLQQRLNRKRVDPALLRGFPAHVRLYDILFDGEEDLRALPLIERRARLEGWYEANAPARMDLSPLIAFADWDALAGLRTDARGAGVEGLMLKRADSIYESGRPKGPWFKWKRDPLVVDAVLMYAQRGHGKRSSFYSDYTFGCWRSGETGGDELVPVGKAYFGFTDAELRELDRWVREHTTNQFGPVREVAPGLVFEVAFDSAHRSTRHKSGIALRFPRISRIRWDKPAEEADRVETLAALME